MIWEEHDIKKMNSSISGSAGCPQQVGERGHEGGEVWAAIGNISKFDRFSGFLPVRPTVGQRGRRCRRVRSKQVRGEISKLDCVFKFSERNLSPVG
jgi:hypothetical protein